MSLLTIYHASQVLHKPSLSKLIFPLLGYANPLIVLMAVFLFLIVRGLPVYTNKFLNRMLAPNLFIYLITEIGVFVSYQQLANEYKHCLGFAFIHSILLSSRVYWLVKSSCL